MERILLTGGAGFIGSHTLVTLLERGYEVAVVDNLANSCEEGLGNLKGSRQLMQDYASRTAAVISLVVLLPTEPVMATTLAPMRFSSSRAMSPRAFRGSST